MACVWFCLLVCLFWVVTTMATIFCVLDSDRVSRGNTERERACVYVYLWDRDRELERGGLHVLSDESEVFGLSNEVGFTRATDLEGVGGGMDSHFTTSCEIRPWDHSPGEMFQTTPALHCTAQTKPLHQPPQHPQPLRALWLLATSSSNGVGHPEKDGRGK